MKTFKTLLIATLLVSQALAQASWKNQNAGTDRNLTDVSFIDKYNGWISGWTGTILHTSDGGITWTQQDAPPNNAYYSIAFADGQNGWASGYAGKLIHTTDGGQNWEDQTPPTSYDIYSLYFIDAQNGWAAGGNYGGFPSGINHRMILHTSNGGTTWTIQHAESYKLPLKEIMFVDAYTGFATGEDGIVLATTNGGMTWSEKVVNTSFNLFDLHFINGKTGYVCGEYLGIPHYAAVFKTTDGGFTWNEMPLGNDEVLQGIYFTDENNGWTVGGNYENEPVIYHTSDGGESWTYQNSPSDHSLASVLFASETSGWAVGFNGTIVSTFSNTVGKPDIRPINDADIKVSDNFPNPFSFQTNIAYSLDGESRVNIAVYNLQGQKIRTLTNGMQQEGKHQVTWDGKDESNRIVPNGTYVYVVRAGQFFQSKKLLLQR